MMQARYRKARRKEKGRLLIDRRLCLGEIARGLRPISAKMKQMTGLHSKHLIQLMNGPPPQREKRRRQYRHCSVRARTRPGPPWSDSWRPKVWMQMRGDISLISENTNPKVLRSETLANFPEATIYKKIHRLAATTV